MGERTGRRIRPVLENGVNGAGQVPHLNPDDPFGIKKLNLKIKI